MCDALMTPADISDQTESIRIKGTRGLNYNWDRIVGSGQQSIFLPLSGFSTAAVATALASLDQQLSFSSHP